MGFLKELWDGLTGTGGSARGFEEKPFTRPKGVRKLIDKDCFAYWVGFRTPGPVLRHVYM